MRTPRHCITTYLDMSMLSLQLQVPWRRTMTSRQIYNALGYRRPNLEYYTRV
jgi:hypothetical protein